MRAFESQEHARRRLAERLQQHGRLEVEDLLRYLEDVSSEPAGEEAYGLALSLRRLSLPPENLHALSMQVRDRLSDFLRIGVAHESIRERLDSAARFFSANLQRQEAGSVHPSGSGSKGSEIAETSRQSAAGQLPSEDPELQPARNHGYEISHSIRHFYKWHLFHNMAALALYWTCFKPSSQPSPEAIPWIEEDVIRMWR